MLSWQFGLFSPAQSCFTPESSRLLLRRSSSLYINIPPSEGHWIPEFLSHGWCSRRGSDWLLLVWWWSRWEQREADLLSRGLTSTDPLMKSQSHQKLSDCLKTSVKFCFHPDHQGWTELYIHRKSLNLHLEAQDKSQVEVCEDCTDDL